MRRFQTLAAVLGGLALAGLATTVTAGKDPALVAVIVYVRSVPGCADPGGFTVFWSTSEGRTIFT